MCMTAIQQPWVNDQVALVHDYLLAPRGAERTFASMCEMWPESPIYTLLYDESGTKKWFSDHSVTTSYLQRTGADQENFRRLLPLFPSAVSRLDTSEHPVVVSSSSAFAHGVRPAPGGVHVCYCHSPFRYAWFERERAVAEVPAPVRPVLAGALAAIRRWDVKAASRVTHYVANSEHTKRRIREFYGRESTIVHPPVEIDRFHSEEPDDYFLLVSEIVPHKRVETAAAAASAAGQKLKVVGSGPDLPRLREQYGSHVQFVGRAGDGELEQLYSRALAVVVPNIEEFGIVAVEAQAAGRPVLAARGGGTLETVVDGETGSFFAPDDVTGLTNQMRRFDPGDYDRPSITAHAQQFSPGAFQSRLGEVVERVLEEHGAPGL
jgi:glycosyltransferase involved in cell wall biosynthesis